MLTKLIIRNFKRFNEVEIELGNPVVFIGPNDSGKTTALQAIALWDTGLRRWHEKRRGKAALEKRPGVTINRHDLIAVPIPDASLLWRALRTRDVQRLDGKQKTQNIRVDIVVEGVTDDKEWRCGFEFDYANSESLYCRPLRLSEEKEPQRMAVPLETGQVRVAFLPPMSGLAANETRLDPGAVNVRLGEGRTAEVLRNLCYQAHAKGNNVDRWNSLSMRMKELFGISLEPPQYIEERSEITMAYQAKGNVRLDLSSSGRGMQQTLLLLAYLEANPNSILLLDEPDAHLEILRQRQIYNVLIEAARERSCQIIIASHSEVILNEAADRDMVVAFVGKPHRIDDRGSQALKSLKEIGFEQYYQAEQTGWAIYLEGSTDLAILRSFAEVLNHSAQDALKCPFVHYIKNQPSKGRDHFRGLREAKKDFVGFILCDRLETDLQSTPELRERMWKRREIENYLCQKETLIAFAESHDHDAGPLFAQSKSLFHQRVMETSINKFIPPAALQNSDDPWWINTKVSDDFLDRVFADYFTQLGLSPTLMKKSNYHRLARFVPRELIAPEITEALDDILAISQQAKPAREQ